MLLIRSDLQGYSGLFISGQAGKTLGRQGSQAEQVASATLTPETCTIWVRITGSGIRCFNETAGINFLYRGFVGLLINRG